VKINFVRAGLTVVAAVATAAGFAGTTLNSQAANGHGVDCPTSGGAVAANGSSLQNAGVQAALGTYNTAAPTGPCATPGTVTYTATGSGTCITEADTNSTAVDFCGTDLPYQHTDFATMNSTGWGRVQTIPVAVSAVAYVTNTSNCAAGDNLSGSQLGQIFGGVIKDWHAIDATNCPLNTTIDLGVRSNACSGTTGAVKEYLAKKDPVDFTTIKANNPCGTTWGTGANITCTQSTNQLLIGCTSDVNLLTYVDESDATTHVPGVARHAIDNAAGTFSTWSSGGCSAAAAAAATPNTTAADWSGTDITDPATGYGDCTFTYQLASSGCVTLTSQGQACHGMTNAQAQTTRAFIEFEVTDAGQAIFSANFYDILPANLQAHAQVGAATL
jgi:hypothetical protein